MPTTTPVSTRASANNPQGHHYSVSFLRYGCHYDIAQSRYSAYTTEMYCLTALECRSPKSLCWQAGFSRGLRGTPAPGGHQQSLACLGWQLQHANLCLHPHVVFSLCTCANCPLLLRTPVIGLRSTLTQYDRILT